MRFKTVLAVVTLLAASSSAAMAMPVAPAPQVSDVEQAAWVCDAWGRCWWRPSYYAPRYYGYYGPRYYSPYRYRRWGYRW